VKIKNLTIQELNIPFKVSFSHAAAARSKTESVIVISESENEHRGYGEGCPRLYVTGETLETVFQFFKTHQQQIMQIRDIGHLISWISEHQEEIDGNPAAWCAIELAFLDLEGQEKGLPIEAVLSLPELNGDFKYTAVLGVNSLHGFEKQFRQYLDMGFLDFKVKVSGNLKEDQEKINLFRSHSKDPLRIRLDANNFWTTSDSAIEYIEKLDHLFFAIEEPLQTSDYEGCQNIYRALKIPIILDESFIKRDQFQKLRSIPEAWMINLRISKMGGVLRSLAIAQQAEALGIPLIVGAQVGETSILTRAALAVAGAHSNNIVAQEGAFGTHLLERDITSKTIMFGKKGIVSVSGFSQKPGLGIEITEADLPSITR
jgi:L-alanine-DL-glutamate epimerase-like enolase superfamily enzyme